MTDRNAKSAPSLPTPSSAGDVAAFLDRARLLAPQTDGTPGRGRLIFSLDATLSRQPTWDSARILQADMFRAAAEVGSLDVQLVYFRSFDECRASRWFSDPDKLAAAMAGLTCRGGLTQIRKILSHACAEAERGRVHALVYVGDCMEERLDDLCERAGRLALQGVPAFLFQEGDDPQAAAAFREIARLTRGAHVRFGAGAAEDLKGLLSAVAVFAAGGRRALADSRVPQARLLLKGMS